jgi:large subunit ribosomal protein L18
MPVHSSYRVQLRRRREKKTDYQARKAFVVSGKPRLVARSSTNNTIAQIIIAKPIGDIVIASAHSRELVKKFGWKAATGNVPAAYLTGLLCGLKAKQKGVTEAILDLGLVSPTKGSKVFSTMAGAVDGGVSIPHSDEKIVKERSRGDHIIEYVESLGSPEEYTPKFSKLTGRGLKPQEFGDHFDKVKADIFAAYGISWKPEPRQRKPAKKPEAKKPEVKPAEKVEIKKTEVKPEVKAEASKPKAHEAKGIEAKPAAAVAKHVEAKVEAKVEAPQPESKPKVEHKPKEEQPKHKPEHKPKAEESETEEKPKAKAERKPKVEKAEAKPKAEKKAKVKKAEEKPAKTPKVKATKAGGKKE